jgi:hypothetical protein
MVRRPRLSTTETGRRWLSQFHEEDQRTAAVLLDDLLLLNDE